VNGFIEIRTVDGMIVKPDGSLPIKDTNFQVNPPPGNHLFRPVRI
jgi:hypothetical protein